MKGRLISWRTARFLAIALAVVIAVLVILFIEGNRRARLAWEKYKHELEQHGEQLEGRAFIPPTVPDEQNFAMAPLFASLNDYVRDPKTGTDVPRNPAALDRLKSINLNKLNSRSGGMPNRAAWQAGKLVPIEEWQHWLSQDGIANLSGTGNAAQDVLAALAKFSPEVDEFARATERPLARFPLHYEKGFAMPIRHVQVLIGFSGVFYLHSLAELESENAEKALRDLKVLDRVQTALQVEPLLISHLVRIVIINDIPQILWRGIIEHRWNDEQLKSIQEILGRTNLLVDQQRVMRAERAVFNDYCGRLRRTHSDLYPAEVLPAGISDERPRSLTWLIRLLPQNAILYHNQVWQNRWIQELILPVIDADAGRVYPRRQAAAEEIVKETKPTLHNFLAKMVLPVYPALTMRTAAAHVTVREGEVACALERFRLKTGRHPETLRDLIPDYLAQPINDIFVDEPFRYRRQPDGSYILYSVGWNGLDDDGVVATRGNSDARDNETGDWVWFGSAQK